MYGDYDDDMVYESEDREEDVSDRDEEDLEGMGPIEGLSGDHGVIEVAMEDDDDDDDDMDEDDDDEDGSDEDDLDSDDMDEVEDRIEIVDDEGNPLEDDGVPGWESDSVDDEEGDEDDDDDGDNIDYDAEVQDLADAADMGDIDDVNGLGRFGNIMRAIEEEDFEHPDDVHGLNDRYMEDEDEDGKQYTHFVPFHANDNSEEEDEEEDEEDDMNVNEFSFDDFLSKLCPDYPPPTSQARIKGKEKLTNFAPQRRRAAAGRCAT